MKRKGPTSTGRHGVPGVMPGAHLPLPVRPKAAPAMRPAPLLWSPPATLESLLLRGPGDPGRGAAGGQGGGVFRRPWFLSEPTGAQSVFPL